MTCAGGKVMQKTEIVKTLLRMLSLLLLSIFIGTLLLFAVRQIPQEQLREQVQNSTWVYMQETEYLHLIQGKFCTQLDNYTDALMVLTTYFRNTDSMTEALLAPTPAYPNMSPSFSLLAYAFSLEYSPTFEAYPSVSNYGRYWHGYQIWLAPALIFFTVNQIRAINLAFQLLLLAGVFVLLIKNGKKGLILPFLMFWVILYPPALYRSFQFSSVYYVTMISCFGLLFFYGKRRSRGDNIYTYINPECCGLCLWFQLTGILLAYFDFLTYPAVSLGVPLILYFSLDAEAVKSFWLRLKEAVLYSACWLFGYAGMWSSKWILASVFTKENIIQDAIDALGNRMSNTTGEIEFTLGGVLQQVWSVVCFWQIALPCVVLLLLTLVVLYRRGIRPSCRGTAVVIGLVGLYPFLWYAGTLNHSGVHVFFTYRELALTGFALGAIPLSLCKQNTAVQEYGE